MIAPWAREELTGVDFGDERLDARAEILLSALGTRPNLSIPAACGGRAEIKAAYRFFDNDKTTFEKVIRPHVTQTRERLAAQPVVLLVQDTTENDVTQPQQQVEGAGELDGARRGFLLHEMQAFTPEGVPLGTVWAQVLNRTDGVSHEGPAQKQRARKHTPIEDKESMRWLSGLREARVVAQRAPATQCICVGDSEADIYELYAEDRGGCPLHWIIRACQDRALEPEGHAHLRDAVLGTPVRYRVELLIRSREAQTAAEDRARRQSRASRQARVEVRAVTVTLHPPWRFDRKLAPVTVNVVLAREPNPPAGESPVEWMLVTTLPIDTPAPVRTVVEYYCVRWMIEILFRTLKSGCRIERRRFEHVDRLLPCVGLYLIVAWRTLFVCRMGRSCPEMDCEAIFEPSEWKSVWVAVRRKPPPQKPPALGVVVRLVACLGGYIERSNSEPGPQALWIGLQRTQDLAWAWDSFGPGAKTASQ